jgi:hypothetical protein
LLAGPLLGTAWAAATRNGWREDVPDDPPGESEVVASLPYTLPGSASAALSARLSALAGWWQRVEPRLGRPLVQLAVSAVFALAVAAQLGGQSLAIALASLLVAGGGGLLRPRWTRHAVVSHALPVLGAWLLGHAAFAGIAPLSALAAVAFSWVVAGLADLDRSPGSVARKALSTAAPWALAVSAVIAAMQPLAAALVALLGSLPLLLAPLLDSDGGRARYFRALQLALAVSMIAAALALGYTP